MKSESKSKKCKRKKLKIKVKVKVKSESCAPTHHCWWGEHLSQCLLSAQSHQPQLQLQGCRQCRCTPAYICKYQICFKTTFFLPVLPYSGWQDLDSLRQCLRQELHWFLLAHSHSGSVQDLAKLNCLLFNLRWLMIQVFIQYI